MPRMDDHPALCPHHARNVALATSYSPLTAAATGPSIPTSNIQSPTSDDSSALLGPVQDFRTATSINHVLGKLLVLLATDRIPPRKAAVIAYICQLLLQSLNETKREYWDKGNSPETKNALEHILNAPSLGTAASIFHAALAGIYPDWSGGQQERSLQERMCRAESQGYRIRLRPTLHRS